MNGMQSSEFTFNGVQSARHDLEQARRVAPNKVMSAEQAVANFVHDGAVVAIGGTNHTRTPMALIWEILRQRRKGLITCRPLSCYETELLVAGGSADRIMTSWIGIGHGWGLARVIRELVESQQLVYEEWSHLGIGLRFHAGAMGVPFLPSMTMLGSDIGKRLGLSTVKCPYTDQDLYAIPSINPDVALIHVQQADAKGNARILGYPIMDVDMAKSAKRVIISTEELVDSLSFESRPTETSIPAISVDAVVVQRYGSYPHECYGCYDTDMSVFAEYMERVAHGGAGAAANYVTDFLTSYADYDAYLAAVGPDKLANAVSKAREMVQL